MLGTLRDFEAEVPGNTQLIKVGIVVLLRTIKDIRVFSVCPTHGHISTRDLSPRNLSLGFNPPTYLPRPNHRRSLISGAEITELVTWRGGGRGRRRWSEVLLPWQHETAARLCRLWYGTVRPQLTKIGAQTVVSWGKQGGGWMEATPRQTM